MGHVRLLLRTTNQSTPIAPAKVAPMASGVVRDGVGADAGIAVGEGGVVGVVVGGGVAVDVDVAVAVGRLVGVAVGRGV